MAHAISPRALRPVISPAVSVSGTVLWSTDGAEVNDATAEACANRVLLFHEPPTTWRASSFLSPTSDEAVQPPLSRMAIA
jgi:hypothetical protein